MRHLNAGPELEELARDVPGRADAHRRVVVLARVRLQHRDQFFHRVRRGTRRHDEHARQAAQHRHRREILQRVVAEVLVEHMVHRVPGGHQHQRVAVGLRARALADADRAARAGLVVHDHRLPPGRVEALADDASHDVGGAPGGEGHDDADGLGRVGLRAGEGAEQHAEKESDRPHARLCLAQYSGDDLFFCSDAASS